MAAHGWQYGINLAFIQDFADAFYRQREQVNMLGGDRIRHNRRGVVIDQGHLDALFAQRTSGLCAGVVKLTGLPDNNRAAPDNQYGFDGRIFRHGYSFEFWAAILALYREGKSGSRI